ncbi:hypothetical protein MYX64_06470 [Nitrospinae bacterium AH_259_B05_G02_I21]|nr:hypothetical protein [Nitrospinae bacterium AH_259_B05_G02_I21]
MKAYEIRSGEKPRIGRVVIPLDKFLRRFSLPKDSTIYDARVEVCPKRRKKCVMLAVGSNEAPEIPPHSHYGDIGVWSFDELHEWDCAK